MATYNGSAFIEEQIATITAQTRLPDELVISDDNSTDDTIARITTIAAKVPFPIRVEVNSERCGSTTNFERAIARCRGDLIALCDQDDIWAKDKLELLERAFESNHSLGVVFSDARLVDCDLRPLGKTLWQSLGFYRVSQRQLNDLHGSGALLDRSFVTGATLAFRAPFRSLILPFPTTCRTYIHDRWLVTLIAAVSKIAAIDRPLIDYRQHSSQQIGAPRQVTVDWSSARWSRNQDQVLSELAPLLLLRTRLATHPMLAVHRYFAAALTSRIAHFQVRSSLPERRYKRLKSVLNELMSGRYARFSNGALSALKDLFIR